MEDRYRWNHAGIALLRDMTQAAHDGLREASFI